MKRAITPDNRSLIRKSCGILFAISIAFALLTFSVTAQEQTEVADSKPPLLKRIVMIGASVTGGFTLSEPLGGPKTSLYSLGNYLESAVLSTDRDPIINHGSSFFFVNPKFLGTQMVNLTRHEAPTMVIATDFLFWFCYGSGLTEDARLELFEEGLRLLETFECPVIVGNLPNARGAIGGILSANQVPKAEVLAKANSRLEEWASFRKNIIVIPLSDFGERAMANRQLVVREKTYPDGQTLKLLQPDKLHASESGCAVLSILILDSLIRTYPELEAEPFLWNPDELVTKTLERLQSTKLAE